MEADQLSLQCGCTSVGDARYDRTGGGSPIEAVVSAIASTTDTDPTAITPLHEYVDTDALDRLFAPRSADATPSGNVLAFSVNGWNVFVRGDGRIRVCDQTGPAQPSPVFD